MGELDAIIKIMEDIRKLEDIRSVVRDFDRSVRSDEERQKLFDAIKKRLSIRIELLDKFRRRIFKHNSRIEQRELITLVKCLEFDENKLGPAKDWITLPQDATER